MNDEFDNLDSVEQMLAYIAESNKEEDMHTSPNLEFGQELHLLSVQTFLKLFGRYKALNDTERDELEQCAEAYNDPENNTITRQAALAHVCTMFFPEVPMIDKEIVRKDDSKVYQTPCEDCSSSPTHLVMFKMENRTEEHFLCEECEVAARAEDGDE